MPHYQNSSSRSALYRCPYAGSSPSPCRQHQHQHQHQHQSAWTGWKVIITPLCAFTFTLLPRSPWPAFHDCHRSYTSLATSPSRRRRIDNGKRSSVNTVWQACNCNEWCLAVCGCGQKALKAVLESYHLLTVCLLIVNSVFFFFPVLQPIGFLLSSSV